MDTFGTNHIKRRRHDLLLSQFRFGFSCAHSTPPPHLRIVIHCSQYSEAKIFVKFFLRGVDARVTVPLDNLSHFGRMVFQVIDFVDEF
jgi:hypothetical protein